MTTNTNVSKLIEIAIEAAIKAGREILKIYLSADFDIEYKADQSPLTIADKQAQHVIVEYLSSTKIPILSEEGKTVDYDEREKWELFWLVDPLDGTKEFIKKNDEFTVNIALVRDNSPIGGVIYVPVTRKIYWGDKNGSFMAIIEDENESISNIQRLPLKISKKNFIVVGSRSHMSLETENYIKSMDTKGKAIEIIAKGSSLKICLVAEGYADVYPRLAPTMEWDTAAGHAIAKFAGKDVYQFENKEPLTYNKENMLNPWFVVK